MFYQQTIRKPVFCEGVGLHSGKKVHLRLLPAPVGTGIVFSRTDLGRLPIPATASHVVSTQLSTTIGVEGATVQTVEHLLAALSAFGVDNLVIELDGPEVPILDGSALSFAALLTEAGVVRQKEEKEFLQVAEPITVSEGEKYITLSPSSFFDVIYHIRFDHPMISSQSFSYRHSSEAFVREIAPARTFGFLKDVERLQAMGLARGGSMESAVVISEDRILNKEGLRFSDEFVRHKILDLIGDLSLIGMPIKGRVEAFCAGHMLHARLMRKVLDHKETWKVAGAAPSRASSKPLSHPSPIYAPLPSTI
ncbi:MAG: UDP-3-O-acyl-N-acetylglucosamine deacetylase [Candidatus Manganitrophaceae bacterium]